MKITRTGKTIHVGDVSIGPGTARALADLIRRKTGIKVHGLTWPLLLQSDGTKYGKTAGGETIWLSPDHMSPYRFYQAWMQTEDGEIRKLLLQLTFLDLDQVDEVVADHDDA